MTRNEIAAFVMGVAIGGGAEQPLVKLLMHMHSLTEEEMNESYDTVFVPLVEEGLVKDIRQ